MIHWPTNGPDVRQSAGSLGPSSTTSSSSASWAALAMASSSFVGGGRRWRATCVISEAFDDGIVVFRSKTNVLLKQLSFLFGLLLPSRRRRPIGHRDPAPRDVVLQVRARAAQLDELRGIRRRHVFPETLRGLALLRVVLEDLYRCGAVH